MTGEVIFNRKSYIPHDMRGGGLFYGTGVDEYVYRVNITAEEVQRTQGKRDTLADLVVEKLRAADLVDEHNQERVLKNLMNGPASNEERFLELKIDSQGMYVEYRRYESVGTGVRMII